MDGVLKENLYYGALYAWNLLFILVAMNGIFPAKKERKKALLQKAEALAVAFVCGYVLSYMVSGIFSRILEFTGSMDADSILIHLLYGVVTLANGLLIVGPAIIAFGAVLWIFKGKKQTKIFMSVLFLLVVSAITNFGAEITYNFFPAEIAESARQPPVWPVRVLIDLTWLLLTYIVYQRYWNKFLKNLLETAEEQISNIILVPCVSYVVFNITTSTLGTYSITISSLEPVYFLIAAIIRISVIIMYLLMYWAIFKAVRVGAGAAKVKAELDVASRIQLSALPCEFPAFPERPECDIYAAMHPAKEVGGDFYDFFFIDEDRLALLIADVSGKGVPAALFMMSARSIIHNQALLGIEPGEIFTHTNYQLLENNKEGMFITAFLGILNVHTGELRFSNAGHNAPYVVQPDGEVRMMEVSPGFVLAALEGMAFRTDSITIKPEEKLILYTDGVTEAVNPTMEMYTEKRLAETLGRCGGVSVQETVEEMVASVNEFAAGAEQADDITVLAVVRT